MPLFYITEQKSIDNFDLDSQRYVLFSLTNLTASHKIHGFVVGAGLAHIATDLIENSDIEIAKSAVLCVAKLLIVILRVFILLFSTL